MFKLLFAVCVAAIAVAVAWMGLHPLEKVALSMKLEEGKTYKVWVDADKTISIERDSLDERKWDEEIQYDIELNPNPDDTLWPGKYHLGGLSSGSSGNFPSIPRSHWDNPDTMEVKKFFLKRLPSFAANTVSRMLIPLYPYGGLEYLKTQASYVVDPFGVPDSKYEHGRPPPPKYVHSYGMFWGSNRRNELVEQSIDRVNRLYPQGPVKVGSKWRVKLGGIDDFSFEEVVDLTCMDRKSGVIILEYESNATTAGRPIRIDTCGVSVRIEFQAAQTARLEIDEATGLITLGEFEQAVEGVSGPVSAPDFETLEAQAFKIDGNVKIMMDETQSKNMVSRESEAGIRRVASHPKN